MTNLCYNCGDCHLPLPCNIPLKDCKICGNLGHTYNFCPLSVAKKDPHYRYWALCHNCEQWHLPCPCPLPLTKCASCGHGGHLDLFCPVNARLRGGANPEVKSEPGKKRRRTKRSDAREVAPAPGAVDPSIHLRIRVDAAKEAFDLLQNHGLSTVQVIERMENPAAFAPGQKPAGDLACDGLETEKVGDPLANAPAFQQATARPGAPLRPHKDVVPEPQPNLPPQGPSNPDTYTAMQQHLGGGGQALGQAQTSANHLLPFLKPQVKGARVAGTAQSQKKCTLGRRCEACARTRKKCPHREPVNSTSAPATQKGMVGTLSSGNFGHSLTPQNLNFALPVCPGQGALNDEFGASITLPSVGLDGTESLYEAYMGGSEAVGNIMFDYGNLQPVRNGMPGIQR